MTRQKNCGNLFLLGLIIVLLLFGLMQVVFKASGYSLIFELSGLVLLSFMTFFGFVGYHKKWGEKILFFVFLSYIGNLVLMWYFFDALYLVLILLCLVGFFMTFPKKSKTKCENKCKVEIVPLNEKKYNKEDKEDQIEDEGKKTVVEANYFPGKYVASKRSNIYHEPKCDWAKKIKEDRRIWFAERKDALNKGFKKHSCVK